MILAALAAGRCHAKPPEWAAARPAISLENVAIVDVERGRLVGPRTVLLENGRIASIAAAGTGARPGAVRIDGRGKFLLPGLVDLHVHLFNRSSGRPPNEWTFPLFVANGVTGVREMNAAPTAAATLACWRERIERGELLAPRVLAAGIAISPKASPSDLGEEIRQARAAGADFIKVFSEAGEPHWRAVLREARAQSMPVCGHVPAQVDVVSAARAGQCSNEHLMQVHEACSARPAAFLVSRAALDGAAAARLRDSQEEGVLQGFDPETCRHVAAELARRRQPQVPTLVLPHSEADPARGRFREDPRWSLLRDDERSRWERNLAGETPADAVLARRRWEISSAIVRTLHASGVPILAGTDAPMPLVYPGFSLHDELELLVASGLSAAEALRSATLGPARFLGRAASSGSISVGKRADAILLDEDPLRDIRNTRRIRAVILDGRLLERAQLDAMLRRAPPGASHDGASCASGPRP